MTSHITRDQLDTVISLTEDFDPDVDFMVNYSGRGMYGAKCIGTVHNGAATPAAFLYFLAEELGIDFLDLLTTLGPGHQDSMGLSQITYWPGLQLVTDGDDDDDDDENDES